MAGICAVALVDADLASPLTWFNAPLAGLFTAAAPWPFSGLGRRTALTSVLTQADQVATAVHHRCH